MHPVVVIIGQQGRVSACFDWWQGWIGKALMAIAIGFAVASISGCGGGGTATTLSPGTLKEHFLDLRIGVSANEVLAELGNPISRTVEGNREELNYGRWQLNVANGRLESKSIVKGQGSVGAGAKVSAQKILELHLGAKLGEIKARLGEPEAIYEVWEGSNEHLTILRYGEWELTFVNGRLNQRSR